MDDFEKDYFKKLKLLANDYKDNRRDLAISRIKMLVAALYRQLFDENEKFDAIITAGNSGHYITKITKIFFEYLNITPPPIITLPIFRFDQVDDKITLHDNSSLSTMLLNELKALPKDANILFLDDEIMAAFTIKATLELMLKAFPNLNSLRCVIVAENSFFEWHHHIPKVSINFFSYSRLIHGLNGNIGYFIPEPLFTEISHKIPDVQSYNHAMAVVTTGSLKRLDKEGNGYFDTTVESICNNEIQDYIQQKNSLLQQLSNIVKEGVDLYKTGQIKFRF